jgi:hypothetical protein
MRFRIIHLLTATAVVAVLVAARSYLDSNTLFAVLIVGTIASLIWAPRYE